MIVDCVSDLIVLLYVFYAVQRCSDFRARLGRHPGIDRSDDTALPSNVMRMLVTWLIVCRWMMNDSPWIWTRLV